MQDGVFVKALSRRPWDSRMPSSLPDVRNQKGLWFCRVKVVLTVVWTNTYV